MVGLSSFLYLPRLYLLKWSESLRHRFDHNWSEHQHWTLFFKQPAELGNPFTRENCCSSTMAQNNDENSFLLELQSGFWSSRGKKCLLHFVGGKTFSENPQNSFPIKSCSSSFGEKFSISWRKLFPRLSDTSGAKFLIENFHLIKRLRCDVVARWLWGLVLMTCSGQSRDEISPAVTQHNLAKPSNTRRRRPLQTFSRAFSKNKNPFWG